MAHALTSNGQLRRAVITGMGVVSACGQDLGAFWESVRHGWSGAKPVTRFDTKDLPSKLAAEIGNFDPCEYITAKKARRYDLSLQFGIVAAMKAMRDSGLDFSKMDPDRAGLIEASSLSGMESAFRGQKEYEEKGYRRLSPFYLINAYSGSGSAEIGVELGIKGHSITYSSGSASGSDVIGYALSMIRADEVDAVVVGGAEAPILPPLYGGFCAGNVMTRHNENPAGAMRPFDRQRDGFLLGEGAAFVVLEELSHALQRGARIYAEVIGHGRSCEAFHAVAPEPAGAGVYRAMEKALRHARLHPTEVDYINAHGTATESNDLAESRAIQRLFGNHVARLAVSSTKPVTGHLLAAAGAIESAICGLVLHHEEMPPTINLEEPADDCRLDYIQHHSRPYPVKVVMNLNAGFGGKNSCLIMRKYPSD